MSGVKFKVLCPRCRGVGIKDHGQSARAKFIRLQCSMDSGKVAQSWLGSKLLNKWSKVWWGEKLLDTNKITFHSVERGFVNRIDIPIRSLFRLHESNHGQLIQVMSLIKLFAEHPIEQINITDWVHGSPHTLLLLSVFKQAGALTYKDYQREILQLARGMYPDAYGENEYTKLYIESWQLDATRGMYAALFVPR